MSLIYNLVLFSFVLVVLVFIYYLYHSNLVNQLTKYDYETSSNPNLMNYLRNEGLLCPENYEYVKSDQNHDYCKKKNSNINCEDTQEIEGSIINNYHNDSIIDCMKYQKFERNSVTNTIEYPKNYEVTDAIKNRCIKKNYTNSCEPIGDTADCELNNTKTGCRIKKNDGTYDNNINGLCKFNNTIWTALNPYYYSKKCQKAIHQKNNPDNLNE